MNDVKTLSLGSDVLLLHSNSFDYPVINSRYRIIKKLGEGGFGRTFLCLDELLDTYVAIKEIVSKDEKSYMSSLLEARSLASFRGIPGIVSAIDYFDLDEKSYIVMDYVEGENLTDYCRNHMPTFADFLDVMKDVFSALSRMHSLGIIHRDISPGNIIVGDEKAVLLDFGSACRCGKCNPIVKRGYSPSEQYDGKVGPWSDVYAMAATISRAYMGMKITDSQERSNNRILKYKYANRMVKDQMSFNALNRLLKVLEKGLSLSPRDRYRDMEKFWEALLNVQNSQYNFARRRKLFLAIAALLSNAYAYECVNAPYGISILDKNVFF